MSNIAISVENISKQYRLGEVSTGTISHDLNRWWAKLRGKEDPFLKVGETNDRTQKGTSDLVWALKDVNFDVKQGEVLGIIGRNGAGKSTLLKVLSKVTQPTTGNIKVRGRIASLLEVGTGFHPELTGRENIYLNGAILGMTKSEISRKFDEILDFSGVERYVDTPVKRYSSGMYVRLAFAVAAHLEPEILIVDEVLAVGDAEFQKKCLGKMKDVSGEGRTVLFVSHNMGAVRGLCTRGVFMNNGTVGFTGSTSSVIDAYFKSNIKKQGVFEIGKASNDEVIVIKQVQLKNAKGELSNDFIENDDLIIEMDCFSEKRVEQPQYWISIRSQYGNLIEANALTDGSRPDYVEGDFKVVCHFKRLNLMPQTYYIHMGIRNKLGDGSLTRTKEIGSFNINSDLRLKGFCGDYLDADLDTISPLYLPYAWNFDDKKYFEFK